MKKILIAASLVCISFTGCTDPGEMTGMGAAAGGAMGAGLGAIIGSQTGDAGSGLAIGAVAGAATGAAIGNVLQAQDETIRSQDEAIERQQHIMAANQRELSELKRSHDDYHTSPSARQLDGMKQDEASRNTPRASLKNQYPANGTAGTANSSANKTFRGTQVYTTKQTIHPNSRTTSVTITERDLGTERAIGKMAPAKTGPAKIAKAAPPAVISKPEVSKSGLQERDISAPSMQVDTPSESDTEASFPRPKADLPVGASASDDCKKASGEIDKASGSKEIADRLFHYRRALRLCPDSAKYHNLLGETYVSLNRTVDAEFEFREALKLDPTLQVARNNLDSLR